MSRLEKYFNDGGVFMDIFISINLTLGIVAFIGLCVAFAPWVLGAVFVITYIVCGVIGVREVRKGRRL